MRRGGESLIQTEGLFQPVARPKQRRENGRRGAGLTLEVGGDERQKQSPKAGKGKEGSVKPRGVFCEATDQCSQKARLITGGKMGNRN